MARNRTPQKPTEAQKAFNAAGTFRMKKNSLRRAQQIASQRSFIYDREPPTCLACGHPRDLIRGLKCSSCEEKS